MPQQGTNPAGWITNGTILFDLSNLIILDVPQTNKISDIISGSNGWGAYDFYEMFCGSGKGGQGGILSAGNKPLIMTETASTVHMAVRQTNGSWVIFHVKKHSLTLLRLLLPVLIPHQELQLKVHGGDK